ncbi:MAG TPA: competence/damage-inducible protein A [Gemmatimonadales bacterium]|nr:competence/damage-inducible protein A [Gemmatimonadales bacterium]
MDIELVTIGTELLLGYTLDTNGAEAARVLAAEGVRIARRTSVPDRADDIRAAVADALRRTGAVLTTGGLGPTRDDITKKVVADLFGVPLDFDPRLWDALVQRFAKMGRVPAPNNRTQADVPRDAVVLPNRWGTAPGIWLEGAAGLAILLPGVPWEMRNLLRHEVAPRLSKRGGGRVVRSLLVRTTGIPESTLAERLGEIEQEIAPLSLAYLPGLEGVDLRLTAWDFPPDDADRRLRAAAELLYARAGEHVYGEGEVELSSVVLAEARARRLRIGTAESCTGGLVGVRLTDIPGSSDVFVGGVVSYDDSVKRALLDVPAALLDQHGAVSEEVARAMAVGAVQRLGVDLSVAVTGIAGPGGGSAEKPVGTVWFATAMGGTVESSRAVLPGTRHEIRARAAQAALFLLLKRIRGSAP